MNGIYHISVIELDSHHDSLDGFLKIFQHSNYRISVFTSTRNINLLAGEKYSDNIVFYEYRVGLKYFFLRKNALILNSSQLIFINTIATDFGAYLAIGKKNNILLRVHNANKQFQPLKNIVFPKSLFFVWKTSSYIARQILGKGFLLFRPLINKRVNYFTFPDQSITEYVLNQKMVNSTRVIPPIPLKIFSPNDTLFSEYSNQLKITIIGAIDEKRRDYEECLNSLVSIFNTDNPPVIELTILGKSTTEYGIQVVSRLKKIVHPNFKLITFNNQVPEKEFIKCIQDTHLIISPITKNASTDIFKEIYGKTKTTGSILDFLKFGKVTLVPSHYSPPNEIKEYMISYTDSNNLEEIIVDLLNSNKLNDLNKRAIEFVSNNYSQSTVLNQTLTIFNSIIH